MTTHIQPNDLALWLRELSVMLRAGETPLAALRAMHGAPAQPVSVRRLAGAAAAAVEHGRPLADGLQDAFATAAPCPAHQLLRASLSSGLPPADALRLAAALVADSPRTAPDPWVNRTRIIVTTGLALVVVAWLVFYLLPVLVLGVQDSTMPLELPLPAVSVLLFGMAGMARSVQPAVVPAVIGLLLAAVFLSRRHGCDQHERGSGLGDVGRALQVARGRGGGRGDRGGGGPAAIAHE